MLRLRNPIMATLRSLRVPYPCHHSSPLQNSKSQPLCSRVYIHGFLPFNHFRTLSTSATSNSSSSELNDDQWLKSNELFTQEDSFFSSSIATDEDWYKAQAEDLEWFRKEEEFYEKRISLDEKQPITIEVPDYLSLSDASLFAQCRMDTFRASGPGGQHRNKTDSGVRLTHVPTGVVAQAVEDRSQHKNRAIAMNRLRILIAAKVRRPVKLRGYSPPPELVRILPSEEGKKSSNVKIGVNNPNFAKGVQALLDLLAASHGFVTYAATVLRVSPASISKILTIDKTVMQAANELLISKGQKPFK